MRAQTVIFQLAEVPRTQLRHVNVRECIAQKTHANVASNVMKRTRRSGTIPAGGMGAQQRRPLCVIT
jgi:hypothetical protein